MTCWPIDEGWDTALVLALLQMGGWCVGLELMLVSLLSHVSCLSLQDKMENNYEVTMARHRQTRQDGFQVRIKSWEEIVKYQTCLIF